MIRKYAEIFCWKNVSSFCSAKATHIFSAKNIRMLCIESAKTVNEMTLNELVKLTTLWTTGPRTFPENVHYHLYEFLDRLSDGEWDRKDQWNGYWSSRKFAKWPTTIAILVQEWGNIYISLTFWFWNDCLVKVMLPFKRIFSSTRLGLWEVH